LTSSLSLTFFSKVKIKRFLENFHPAGRGDESDGEDDEESDVMNLDDDIPKYMSLVRTVARRYGSLYLFFFIRHPVCPS